MKLKTQKLMNVVFLFFILLQGSYGLVWGDVEAEPTKSFFELNSTIDSQIELFPIISGGSNDEFSAYLQTVLENRGAFPNQGSTLKDTFHALKLLNLAKNTSCYTDEEIEAFVYTLLDPDTNLFLEDDTNVSTMVTNYHAINILSMVGATFSADLIEDQLDFINRSVIDHTSFALELDKDPLVPDLETMYHAFSILDILNTSYATYVDEQLVFEYLLAKYNYLTTDENYGLFGEEYDEKYEDTYYCLELLNKYDRLEERQYLDDFFITIGYGAFESGNNESLAESGDNQTLTISSSNLYQASFYIEFSWDYFLAQNTEEVFDFQMYLNLSKEIVSGQAYLKNAINGTWMPFTNPDHYSGMNYSTPTKDIVVTPKLNISDYEFTGGTEDHPYDRYGRFSCYFYDSSGPYNITIDQFSYQYAVFNKSLITDTIASHYSHGFDQVKLEENYFGFHALQLCDGILDEDQKADFLFLLDSFRKETGGYASRYHETIDNLEATFYVFQSYDSLDLTDAVSRAEMAEFVSSWKFPDGGFGSYREMSLFSTYHVVNFLSDADLMTAEISTQVLSYVQTCKAQYMVFYNDYNQKTSVFGDTYYAILLNLLLNSTYASSEEFIEITTTFINSQNSAGYFAQNSNLEDTFYVVEILGKADRLGEIKYLAALQTFIQNLQLYYGGFLANNYVTEATIAATCYAAKISLDLEFSENLRFIIEDQNPGIIEYVGAHQVPASGGIFEESEVFYEEELELETVEASHLVSYSLIHTHTFNKFNISGLMGYFINKIDELNDLSTLMTDNKETFYEWTLDRCLSTAGYNFLRSFQLDIVISVDRETVFPNLPPDITVEIRTTNGILLEGCVVSLIQGQRNILMEDHQNGTYTNKLYAYNYSVHDALTLKISHEEYFDFSLDYDLMICDPIDLDKLFGVKSQWVALDNKLSIEVPVVNLTDDSYISTADLALFDINGTKYAFEFNAGTELYECNIDYDEWQLHSEEYLLKLSGDKIRSEQFFIDVFISSRNILLTTGGGVLGIAGIVTTVVVILKKKNK